MTLIQKCIGVVRVWYRMTLQEQIRAKEYAYCLEHPIYFVETYVKIEHKGKNPLIQPFTLWDGQKRALESIVSNKRNIILKARQLGITWLVLSNAARKLVCRTGYHVGAVSRAEDEAAELVRRLAVILDNMPALIANEENAPAGWTGATFKKKSMEITIHFPDGSPDSIFKAALSGQNALRGFSLDEVILDEWAFQTWDRELWNAIFPTINDSGACVTGLSTIKRGSLFEDIFTNPDNGFNKIFLSWRTNPERDDAWYSATVGALGAAATLEEYPDTIEEALMIPGGQAFPEVKAETHKVYHDDGFWEEPVVRYVSIDYGLDMFSVHWIAINTKGKARVYREFNESNMTIGAACDAYKRLTGDEKISMILAPSDLWNRDQVHGKSRALFFHEHGMTLTKVSRDFEGGVAAMKQWLSVGEDGKANLTIEDAPKLYKCLQKILIDPKKPNVYAKQPHELTHSVDSLRYFCIYYISPAEKIKEKRSRLWTQDLLDDYSRADAEIRKIMEERYGKP